jgi:hypothetical protein
MPRLLYPRYPLDRRLGGPQIWAGLRGEEEYLGIRTMYFLIKAHTFSQVGHMADLPFLHTFHSLSLALGMAMGSSGR